MPAMYVKQAGFWKGSSQNPSFPFEATVWVKKDGVWRQTTQSQISGGGVGIYVKQFSWQPAFGG